MDTEQLADLIGIILGKIPYPWAKNKNCYSRSAKNLVLATIVHESDGGQYIEQVGGGPAKGICQMEPPTFRDHFDYMKINKNYRNWGITRQALLTLFRKSAKPDPDELKWNNALAIAMCRVHYLRAPNSLPPYNDLDAISRYWHSYYNRGDRPKQKIREFKEDYYHYVGEPPE